jgi:hypothetical protein
MLDPLLVVEPGGQHCFEGYKPFLSLSWHWRRPARAVQMRATRPAWAAEMRATSRALEPSLARHRSCVNENKRPMCVSHLRQSDALEVSAIVCSAGGTRSGGLPAAEDGSAYPSLGCRRRRRSAFSPRSVGGAYPVRRKPYRDVTRSVEDRRVRIASARAASMCPTAPSRGVPERSPLRGSVRNVGPGVQDGASGDREGAGWTRSN